MNNLATKTADLLNEAIKIDPSVINVLMTMRRICRPEFLDHPHIIVHSAKEKEGPYYIGLLGIINGILLANGSKDVISAIIDEHHNITSFGIRKFNNDIS